LHPSAVVDHLANTYNIKVGQDDSEHDPRIYEFLDSFHRRLWGSGFRRPDEEEVQDEAAVSLDSLGNARVGKCVLEWLTRGPEIKKSQRTRSFEGNAPGRDKTNRVERGLVGAVLNLGRRKGLGRVEIVPLTRVVEGDRKSWTTRATGEEEASRFPLIEEIWVTLTDTVVQVKQQDPTAAITAGLSFNLSLTERQRAAKSGVGLPFAPKEDQSGRQGQ
jgi:hypothetical protein